MRSAIVFMLGVCSGAQVAGIAVLLHETGVVDAGGLILTLGGGGGLGGLVALVLWDVARQGQLRKP